MKNITRKDIAGALGVSVSVVSRALNNSGYVERDKRKQIIEMAKQMGYARNPIAMALQQKRTNQLLFFCGDLTATYYNQMYHGMAREAKKRGYHVLAIMNETDFDMVKSTMADGILFPNETVAEAYASSVGKNYHLPAVAASFAPSFLFSKAIPTVTIDNHDVVNTAIDYLMAKGHKKIGITLPFNYGYVLLRYNFWKDRMNNEIGADYKKYVIDVQQEVKENKLILGIKDECSRILHDCLYSDLFYIGKEVADCYMKMEHQPTAILCFNDDIAFGTIERLKEVGVKVPQDVSIMGIDGVYTREKFHPRVTTVNMYPEKQGSKCVETLINILNKQKYKYVDHFKVSISEGDSVKDLR